MIADDLELTETRDGTRLRLRVRPGARKNAITGMHGGALKVSVTAPADKGKANEAVLELLSDALAVPRSALTLVSGAVSRTKVVLVPLAASRIREFLGL